MKRFILVIALHGCAVPRLTPNTGGLQPSVIEGLRDDAKAVWRAEQEIAYKRWTEGATTDPAEAFKGHERLYSREAIKRLGVAINEAGDRNVQRSLRWLRHHVAWELLGGEIGAAQEAFDAAMAQEVLQLDGQSVPFLQLMAIESAEKDAAKRRRWQQAAGDVYTRLSDVAMKLEAETQSAAKRIGFPSYLDFASDVRGSDLTQTSRAAERFLAESDAMFLPAMKKVVEAELGSALDRTHMADMPRLLSGSRYDGYLGEELVVPTQQQVMRALAFDPASTPLRIDLAKRPGKVHRQHVFPVSVPQDVRISLYPRGGLLGIENALHATGTALLYARSKTPVFEFQVLGDETVATAYGMLFWGLVSNPEWVKTNFARIPEAERAAFLRFVQIKRMLLARRYAAKVMFEVGWHSGQTNDPARLYQNVMSRAHGFRFDENDGKRWLVDHEPLFYSAEVLRAWMLAAQIEAKLVTQFGRRWFERPEAGAWLDSQWSNGLELSADEVAKGLGYQAVDGKALLDKLTQKI